MFGLGRILGLLVALSGGLVTSQAPELAQQYRQRMNGAMNELGGVIAAFDRDAANNNLTRADVLKVYDASTVPVLRDRGRSMREAIDRYGNLVAQSQAFESLPPIMRPAALLKSPDTVLLKGTISDFEPAVPVTPHGLVWTALGVIFGGGLSWLIGRLFRRRKAPPVRNIRV